MTRRALLCVLLLMISLGGLPASFATGDIDFDGDLNDDAANIGATDEQDERRPDGDTAGGVSADQTPLHWIVYPACSGNSPVTGLDSMCPGVEIGCEPPYFQVYAFVALATVAVGEPGWSFVGQECNDPGAGGASPTPFPGMTLEDFQRLPLPAGASTVQPPSEHVLINMPTIVYATEVEPTVIDTELLSYPVQVRATPQRYSWDFGDGTVIGPTRDAGAPWPALRNHHAYTERGMFDITMTTHYTGEYSVAGGPWLPIPGEAQVASAPVTRQAIAGRNELVADPIP